MFSLEKSLFLVMKSLFLFKKLQNCLYVYSSIDIFRFVRVSDHPLRYFYLPEPFCRLQFVVGEL